MKREDIEKIVDGHYNESFPKTKARLQDSIMYEEVKFITSLIAKDLISRGSDKEYPENMPEFGQGFYE